MFGWKKAKRGILRVCLVHRIGSERRDEFTFYASKIFYITVYVMIVKLMYLKP